MNALHKVTIISFFLFVITYWQANAQVNELRFEHITVEQGLPNNSAIRVMQDQKGYIWVATYNGLCKFDGYNFTTYQFDPDDTSSIGGNVILFFGKLKIEKYGSTQEDQVLLFLTAQLKNSYASGLEPERFPWI
jgi:ligand-binding sensor domain-containing protein